MEQHLTGSMKLVTILNRFEHNISKTKLEIESALAETCLQQENAAVMPTNICPNAAVSTVWDNKDFKEETPSGKNTTHCTTDIVSSCAPEPNVVNLPMTLKKSIQSVPEKITKEYRYRSKRIGPPRIDDATSILSKREPQYQELAHRTDILWFLS